MPNTVHLSETKRSLLDRYLRGDVARTPATSGAIPRRPPGEPAPLSLTQQQLWLREVSVAGIPPLYNESIVVRLSGRLEVDALERSLCEIVRRHEAWRTTFDRGSGQPVQIIHPAPVHFPLPVVDLRGIPQSERETEAIERARKEAQQPFDFERGPLVRATLVRMAEEEHRLFLVAHQSIVDGVSVYQVFPRELAALYKAFSVGAPSPLPELPIQYADFAYWQRQWFKGEELARQVAYWQGQLGGELRVLAWPNDRPRPAAQTFCGAIQPFRLSRGVTEAVRELSRREGVTLFMILLAGFVALLHRYTEQEDIVVGTLSPAGRKRSEVQGLLGYFLNPVALRCNLEGDPTFRELLEQTRRVLAEAISHDDVPFEHLVKELNPRPDPSRNPFFTVALSLQPSQPDLDAGWEVTSMDVASGGAMWDLYIAFIDRRNGMLGRAQYNPELFDVASIDRLIEDLQGLLEAATCDPAVRVSSLPVLSAQRAHANPRCNGTASERSPQ